MNTRPMTSEEWAAARARAEALAKISAEKRAAYGLALAAHLSALSELRASTDALEVTHGDSWWRFSDTPVRAALKEKIQRLRVECDRARRASVRAEMKWERAAAFQVIRTYTDATGWVANPRFAAIAVA